MKHVPMRVSLVLAAITLVGIASVGAQLFPPDNLGMRMGHVLLNVSDVDAERNRCTVSLL